MTSTQEEGPSLRRDDFVAIRRLAHGRFGLWLRDGKEELVRTRLGKELRRLGLRTFEDYVRILERDSTGELLEQFTNLLTTNHTTFFREAEHFRFLETEVLPQFRGRSCIEIWCAACATGEEAYTLAICTTPKRGSSVSAISILATDISTRALQAASRGIYDESRFSTVTPDSLRTFLLRSNREHSRAYRMRPELRERVRFGRLNLLDDWSFARLFPVIFCRNVMIYFDRDTQSRLVSRLAAQLEPGGYLFVGHSESLNGLNHGLVYAQPAVYRKPGKLSPDGSTRR